MPGPRPSNSSDESVLMCLSMSSEVIESSAGLSSAGKLAACAAGVAVAPAAAWFVGGVVETQAQKHASRSASEKRETPCLFIVGWPRFGREVEDGESFAATGGEVNRGEFRVMRTGRSRAEVASTRAWVTISGGSTAATPTL